MFGLFPWMSTDNQGIRLSSLLFSLQIDTGYLNFDSYTWKLYLVRRWVIRCTALFLWFLLFLQMIPTTVLPLKDLMSVRGWGAKLVQFLSSFYMIFYIWVCSFPSFLSLFWFFFLGCYSDLLCIVLFHWMELSYAFNFYKKKSKKLIKYIIKIIGCNFYDGSHSRIDLSNVFMKMWLTVVFI